MGCFFSPRLTARKFQLSGRTSGKTNIGCFSKFTGISSVALINRHALSRETKQTGDTRKGKRGRGGGGWQKTRTRRRDCRPESAPRVASRGVETLKWRTPSRAREPRFNGFRVYGTSEETRPKAQRGLKKNCRKFKAVRKHACRPAWQSEAI